MLLRHQRILWVLLGKPCFFSSRIICICFIQIQFTDFRFFYRLHTPARITAEQCSYIFYRCSITYILLCYIFCKTKPSSNFFFSSLSFSTTCCTWNFLIYTFPGNASQNHVALMQSTRIWRRCFSALLLSLQHNHLQFHGRPKIKKIFLFAFKWLRWSIFLLFSASFVCSSLKLSSALF